jgi:hypothetical protein
MDNESALSSRKNGKVVRDSTYLKASAMPQHESGHIGHAQPRFCRRVKKHKGPVDAVEVIMWTGSEEHGGVAAESCMHRHASDFGHLFLPHLIGRMCLKGHDYSSCVI